MPRQSKQINPLSEGLLSTGESWKLVLAPEVLRWSQDERVKWWPALLSAGGTPWPLPSSCLPSNWPLYAKIRTNGRNPAGYRQRGGLACVSRESGCVSGARLGGFRPLGTEEGDERLERQNLGTNWVILKPDDVASHVLKAQYQNQLIILDGVLQHIKMQVENTLQAVIKS